LENIINEWGTELEDHVNTFTRQAIEVAKWDREVMENGDKIFKLHTEVNRLQVAQKELDQNLEMIFTQQTELHQLLESIETEVETVYNNTDLSTVDIEREKGYQLAEDINGQLNDISSTLQKLIAKLNASQEKTLDNENPLHQVIKILNAHLNSLQWIDQSSSQLQSKMQDVNKQLNFQLQEQERLGIKSTHFRRDAFD